MRACVVATILMLCNSGQVIATEQDSISMRVINPSQVEAALFRHERDGKETAQGVVHGRQSVTVTTYPGEKWVVYFPCHQEAHHSVPNAVADEWKLPARPCR